MSKFFVVESLSNCVGITFQKNVSSIVQSPTMSKEIDSD